MKQLKMVGLMLLAVFALGAFAASTASAEEGLLPTQEAKEASGEGGGGTLKTLGGEEIKCEKVSILNVLFLPKSDIHGTADLHFKGCTALGLFEARTLLDEPGVILAKVLFLICLINSAALVFGILIEPTETVHIEVKALGTLVLVKGAVIAENLSTNEGKEFKASLKGTNGDQEQAVSCEIAGKKLSHTLEAARDSATKDEMASETTSFTLKFGEVVKLMDT